MRVCAPRLFLFAGKLRCNLKHRTAAFRTAICRRTVEIASGIEDHATVGIVPVRVVEVMEHLLFPAPTRFWRQLEYRTYAVTLVRSRAIKIVARIEDQAGVGIEPVLSVEVEVVQYLFRPTAADFGRQLEHRAVVVSAAQAGRTVKIAGCT
jgi:hypothetical protein